MSTWAEADNGRMATIRDARQNGVPLLEYDASTGASVPIALGIPAIAIGAGGTGGGTHTPAEWYDDSHGSRGLQRALRIVLGAAGLR
jgi:hypothetical protein